MKKPDVVFPFEQSNIHPLFEQICDIIRPTRFIEPEMDFSKPEVIELRKKLVKIEAARAEAKIKKLKKINIEVKTLKNDINS